MKLVLALLALSVSFSAGAESLTGCKLYVHGAVFSAIEQFSIDKYASAEPEADIDGGLLEYKKDAATVTMSFSNECDNMYEITFSNAAIKKALSGEYKTIIGKASIAVADVNTDKDGFDQPVVGLLKCEVKN